MASRRPRAIPLAALVALAAVGLCALLVAASVHAFQGNSDGATVVVEGASMRHGNLLLHGWRLSLDSFWAVDVPFYALGVLAVGVRPALLHVVPAVIAALVVLVGALMAGEGRVGASRVAGIVTVVALLGLPSHALAVFLLQGPLHVGTALWCLVAFWLLRHERFGVFWAGGVVALAAGLLGDAMALGLGVAPVLLAGLAAMVRERRWGAGVARVAAAGAGVGLALAVRAGAVTLGTFSISKTGRIASGGEVATNLGLLPGYLAKLLGVGNRGFGTGGVPTALGLVHVVGLLLAGAAVVAGIAGIAGAWRQPGRHRARRSSSLDDLLTFALVADVVLFVVLTRAPVVAYARYLTDAVVFASILAGRLVARAAADLHRARGRPSRLRVAAGVLGAGVVAAFAASFGFTLAQPAPVRPVATLARFLTAHELHNGIGDYWSASVVTVESRGRVRVRPVVAAPSGVLESYPHNSEARWYDGSFRFVVYDAALPFGGVDEATAAASFGPPARRYDVGGYRVLVFAHPVHVPLAAPSGDRPTSPAVAPGRRKG